LGSHHDHIAIDYDRLPADASDNDPAKLAYAEKILTMLASLPPPKDPRKR
jgi:hypothetical protein